MKSLSVFLRVGFAAAILGLAGARVSAQAPPNYTVVDLGTLRTDGTGSSDAHGINSQGDVVGQADGDDGSAHAFLWETGAGIRNLELSSNGHFTAGGASSAAYGVSYDANGPARMIAGEGLAAGPPNGSGQENALVMDFQGTVDINGQQAFNGGDMSAAGAVNSSGVAVGWAMLAAGSYHGFRYDPSGTIRDLGTLGGSFSDATAINGLGDIVGFATDGNGNSSAAFWSHTAGSAVAIPGLTLAYGINDAGLAVGGNVTPYTTNVQAAAYNTATSAPVTLAPIVNQSSIAFAVNNTGQVVGAAGSGQDLLLGSVNNMLTAIVWENGAAVNLNTRITDSSWELAEAEAINDNGQIVGVGFHNGNMRGFLLSPPPPPAITGVTAGSKPFHLTIKGDNFHSTAQVLINGAAVPTTVFQSATSLQARGGKTLKAMVPKGVTVQVTVRNLDDGSVSAAFAFTR